MTRNLPRGNAHRKPLGLIVLALLAAIGCGGGGDEGGDDPVSAGLSSNFIADSSPFCPGSPDTLGLTKISAVGRTAIIGVTVTDCNASLGIYGVVLDIDFDPLVLQCESANPCDAGTVLTSPLLTSAPQCTCNNTTGEILAVFSKRSPGTNDTITGTAETILSFTMRSKRAGIGRIDMTATGSLNGSTLVTLSGGSATAIGAMSYVSGAVVAQ
jgi:hypothetical protein